MLDEIKTKWKVCRQTKEMPPEKYLQKNMTAFSTTKSRSPYFHYPLQYEHSGQKPPAKTYKHWTINESKIYFPSCLLNFMWLGLLHILCTKWLSKNFWVLVKCGLGVGVGLGSGSGPGSGPHFYIPISRDLHKHCIIEIFLHIKKIRCGGANFSHHLKYPQTIRITFQLRLSNIEAAQICFLVQHADFWKKKSMS